MNKILLIVGVIVVIVVIVLVNILIIKSPKSISTTDTAVKIEEKCDSIDFDVNFDCDNDLIIVDNKGVKIDDFTFRLYHGNRVEWINASDMGLLGLENIVPIKEGERKEIKNAVSMLKGFDTYKVGVIPIVKVKGFASCDYEIKKEFSC